ncbi:MAG: hypothetical protein ACKV19_23390 [Verrucomicrobiales bacterium]
MQWRAGRLSSPIGRGLFLSLAAGVSLTAQEPPPPLATAPPAASPLPSAHPQTVEFSLTGANGTPMDKKLFGFDLDDMRCLWWHWEAPETGWYAIDRPDEPDGASDEFPMACVFARGTDETLAMVSTLKAWDWYRAAWFRACKGQLFAFAMAGKPSAGRWRLRRLATHPVPPGEEAIELPSAPGVMLTWKLTRARMGRDDDPQEEVIELGPRDEFAFKGDTPPTAYPPGVKDSFNWSWVAPRSGIFEFSRPPDSYLEVKKDPAQEGGPELLAGLARSGSLRIAASAGQQLDFSLSLQRIDSEVVLEAREIPRPSNVTPDKPIFLQGVSGEISVLNPDALGPADAPPGTYHPDRWPLWWKFVAPTDGRFVIDRAYIETHSYTDVREEFFTLMGRFQVYHPDLESLAATLNDTQTHGPGPRDWHLSPGDTLWIRASSPEIFFEWSWEGE